MILPSIGRFIIWIKLNFQWIIQRRWTCVVYRKRKRKFNEPKFHMLLRRDSNFKKKTESHMLTVSVCESANPIREENWNRFQGLNFLIETWFLNVSLNQLSSTWLLQVERTFWSILRYLQNCKTGRININLHLDSKSNSKSNRFKRLFR